MSFQDKMLECSECGKLFTFNSWEQEAFQSTGYTNEPKCCPECRRQARKQERYGNSNSSTYVSCSL